jgi:hypothetical protein
MKLDTSKLDFLDAAMKYASSETRSRLADALYALLNESARHLKGNTPETDIEWFAKFMTERAGKDAGSVDWEWVASIVIDALPHYQARVAERMSLMAQVVSEIASAERKELRKVANE